MSDLSSSGPLDATLSVAKAARILGVHPNTIRTWSDQGRLRYFRINTRGDRRYRAVDLRRFMADAEQEPGQRRSWDRGSGLTPSAASAAGSLNGATRRSASAILNPNPAPAGPNAGVQHLVQLASLAGNGSSLERVLATSARLVREATGSTEVTIWERRDHGLVRRAVASPSGRPPASAASSPALASRAVTARRPAIDVRRASRGIRGALPKSEEIAVPIALGESPWGALLVRLGRVLPAGDQTISWLEAAAAILATGIRTSGLLAEATNEVQRAEALRQAATDTNASLELEDALSRLVDHAMALFGADRSGLFLRDGDVRTVVEVSRGLSPAYLAAVRQFSPNALPVIAATERRPLFANDYRTDPRSEAARAAVIDEGYDTIAAAPLLDGDQAIGVLCVYHDRPKAWTPVELETLAAFASQATVAIRTSQQFHQLSRWAAQLQSIHQLGARLSRLTTVEEIGSAIATELDQLITYDNVRVYRVDGQDLIAVALQAHDDEYDDETPELVRSRIGEGITGWVAANGLAQNLPDTSIDPRTEDIPGSAQFDESMLLAPTIHEDRVLGVIVLVRRGLGQFSDDDLRLLEIYAGFAAQAMASVESTERLRDQSAILARQLRSQRELLQITESILSTLDPHAILDQIADRLGRLLRYDAISIEQYDRRTERLTALTSKGSELASASADGEVEASIAAWVIQHNRARQVGVGARESPAAEASGSRIVAPLRGRDGVSGLLTVTRNAGIEPFSPEDFELAQLFAGQVSIALQNAETHRAVEVRARTDDLTGLLNHGSLRDWLVRSAAEARPFSLVMVDLDHFKAVNDAFGHQAGDRLLSRIAYAIVAAGRETDLVFRYGGDEFAVLLPATGNDGAQLVADRIATAVHGVGIPAVLGKALDITVSMGVATFPEDAASAEDLLLAADRACFVAKRTGGNRIATAAEGLALAAEFSLQEPTPVDPPSRSAA